MQTMSTFDPLLKEVLQSGVNDQLENENRAITRIKKTDGGLKENGGKYVRFTAHVGRNNGLGSRNEMEALPKAGRQRYIEGKINMRYHYAGIQLSGQTFDLASSSPQAFASAVDEEMTRVKDDIAKDQNFMFFGDGLGTRGAITGVATGQVIPLRSIRHIQKYGIYDIHTPGNAVKKGTVEVSKVDRDTNTITVIGTVPTLAAKDILVRQGNYDREWHGIQSIISETTSLHGINPNVEEIWKAEVTNLTANTPISESVLLKQIDDIYRNGGKTTVAWTTLGIIRNYFALLAQERQFVNKDTFEGGFKGVAILSPNAGEIPLLSDIDAPLGEINFLNEKVIHRYDATGGYKYMDRDGNMWKQVRSGDDDFDAYKATLRMYGEMGTTRRNTHGKITNLQDDTY